MVLHVQNISQQGIFNENLRRSFEKLTADKSDIKKEKVNNIIFKKSNLQKNHSGIIKIVNTSSESESDSLSPSTNIPVKPFNRNVKTRGAIRRQGEQKQQQKLANSNNSDILKTNKCDDDKQRDIRRKFDLSNKDRVILGLRKNLDALNSKLNSFTYQNIKLKKENADLKEREFELTLLSSGLEKQALTFNEREQNLEFVINRLSGIVQTQDHEIARLRELNNQEMNKKNLCSCRNSDIKNKSFFAIKEDNELSVQLKETEIKLSEQLEINQQLKQYLEIVLLKLCD